MANTITDPSPFITTAEAANQLGLSVSTVRKLALTGRLDAIKVGKDIRIRRESVPALIEASVFGHRE